MQEIWHKHAEKLSYDSMCRAMFMETYNALWAMKRLPFDGYSSTGWQGRELRFAFGLNSPLNQNLITTFSRFFAKLFWPFPQSFCAFFSSFFLCEHEVYIDKGI